MILQALAEGKMFPTARCSTRTTTSRTWCMAGCGDKKVYQWDADTGDLVQVINAGAVPSIDR